MADKALLIGINKYENITPLQGCLNDVKNMKNLLIDSFGFDEGNIKVIPEKEAVYDTIVDEFHTICEDLSAGDRMVFHFSGHGSFIDSDDDDEPIDELLCLYDMDWGDSNTYLLDDELGELLDSVPDGVLLTVILDACHSGNGSKGITKTGRVAKSIGSKTQMLIEDNNTRSITDGQVIAKENISQGRFARFAPPPKRIQNRFASKASPENISRFALKNTDALNHQLLAAARDDQVAADAFLDSEFQGAFTHYLCNASKSSGTGLAVDQLVTEVKSSLAKNGFPQVPQLEGLRKTERLFGGPASAQPSGQSFDDEIMQNTGGDKTPLDVDTRLHAFNRLTRVHEKFLDLGQQILGLDTTSSAGSETSDPTQRSDEVIVYVHGISQHREGYSRDWFNSMKPHLARDIPTVEVVWSDLVNPRSAERALVDNQAAKDFQKSLSAEIKAERDALDELGAGHPRPSDRGLFDSGFSLDDFVRYMFFESTRQQILKRFTDKVLPLLETGKTIHIISHSWGTVVAYEGLRNMDAMDLSGRVRNLFTVGSALARGTVQRNLFSRVTDGRKPSFVNRIFNIHAGGDAVGGSIKSEFDITSEHLSLTPVGCSTIPFTNIAWSLTCAHSSYFKSDNLVVNRNILAKQING